MVRQHTTPVLIDDSGATALRPLGLERSEGSVSEADIQALVHQFPSCLPIAEIDRAFADPVPICRELNTSAGPIDNFLITASGLPVLVECKLWRNPEGRREVVGQILDYAKELSRWSASDLQREVSKRLGGSGNRLLEMVRVEHPDVDEVDFNDSLTANLRRGRFLLLIVGDGIREGVEAIAEYVQQHAGLHFSLGLVELPIFLLPDGRKLVTPRVLAKTSVITRTVVAIPEGYAIDDDALTSDDAVSPEGPDPYQLFWREFLDTLKLDDPEQQIPRPSKQGYIDFMMPAPEGSVWINSYRNMKLGEVGTVIASRRVGIGEYVVRTIADDWEHVSGELGPDAKLATRTDGRPYILASRVFGDLNDADIRKRAFVWLADQTNRFVNAVRPRVRSAVADYNSGK
jgi:hypothetical protein